MPYASSSTLPDSITHGLSVPWHTGHFLGPASGRVRVCDTVCVSATVFLLRL